MSPIKICYVGMIILWHVYRHDRPNHIGPRGLNSSNSINRGLTPHSNVGDGRHQRYSQNNSFKKIN